MPSTKFEWSYSLSNTPYVADSDSDSSPRSSPSSKSASILNPPLSDDTQFLLDLDLSAREDTAVYKPNPWSIAKVNAASRPAPVEAPTKPLAKNVGKEKKPPKGLIADMLRKQAQEPSSGKSSGLRPGIPPRPTSKETSVKEGPKKTQGPSGLSHREQKPTTLASRPLPTTSSKKNRTQHTRPISLPDSNTARASRLISGDGSMNEERAVTRSLMLPPTVLKAQSADLIFNDAHILSRSTHECTQPAHISPYRAHTPTRPSHILTHQARSSTNHSPRASTPFPNATEHANTFPFDERRRSAPLESDNPGVDLDLSAPPEMQVFPFGAHKFSQTAVFSCQFTSEKSPPGHSGYSSTDASVAPTWTPLLPHTHAGQIPPYRRTHTPNPPAHISSPPTAAYLSSPPPPSPYRPFTPSTSRTQFSHPSAHEPRFPTLKSFSSPPAPLSVFAHSGSRPSSAYVHQRPPSSSLHAFQGGPGNGHLSRSAARSLMPPPPSPLRPPTPPSHTAYAHPSLLPAPDESWSTLPRRKKPAPTQPAVKTSGKFRIPILLSAPEPATKRRKVTLYMPPPPHVSAPGAEIPQGEGERWKIVRAGHQRHGGGTKTQDAVAVTKGAPASGSGRTGSSAKVDPPAIDDDLEADVDIAAIRARYPGVRAAMKERRLAAAKVWDELCLPSCGVVHHDPSIIDEDGNHISQPLAPQDEGEEIAIVPWVGFIVESSHL